MEIVLQQEEAVTHLLQEVLLHLDHLQQEVHLVEAAQVVLQQEVHPEEVALVAHQQEVHRAEVVLEVHLQAAQLHQEEEDKST